MHYQQFFDIKKQLKAGSSLLVLIDIFYLAFAGIER